MKFILFVGLQLFLQINFALSLRHGVNVNRFTIADINSDELDNDLASISLKNLTSSQVGSKYLPTWDSLDTRPLPGWYDEAKIGIFIHWGVFSVPSYTEWFWNAWTNLDPQIVTFMKNYYPPGFTYQDFGREFTAEFFDPTYWADVFSKAGAKYVVLTSKHHEGFTLWPSKYSFSWNAMDVGPKRDLVGELANAIRTKTNITFGVYHSMFEWYHPLWLSDQKSGFNKTEFVTNKVIPELKELVTNYKPEILWSDGDWVASAEYWTSTEFLAWLYNDSPVKDVVVTNDRWGQEAWCKHGDFFNCKDHFNPGVLQPHKWENCATLDKGSWGYRRIATVQDYLTPEELLEDLIKTIAYGGNYLINIGPTKEGTLPAIMEERLVQMGQWLQINGQAIYLSKPWTVAQVDTATKDIYYTSNKAGDRIFAFVLHWPGEQLMLGSVDFKSISKIEILGTRPGVVIRWTERSQGGIVVEMPRMETIRSNWAWTLTFSLVK